MSSIAVIVPCYKVRNQILTVLRGIGNEVSQIYVVDDACPEQTGIFVLENIQDDRIKVIILSENQGVGGAVKEGYFAALADGWEIFVKIDGDGQMDPKLISEFVEPIAARKADYTKGNRFYDLEHLNRMPKVRLIGNSILSFMNKISSGYWNIFDPTNGYTAIHRDLVKRIAFNKVHSRYFFETDMLFRLNILKAQVVDIPMDAKYGDEVSNLKITSVFGEFLVCHVRNFFKRIFYNYYLRDMSLASVELPIGIVALLFGLIYGGSNWYQYGHQGLTTPVGTVVISTIAVLFGTQLILAFLAFDIASVPRRPIHHRAQ
ncbi:glycosyltransferase family 2 protein [Polynucleobacter sp. 15G-AUS-farblos]|uniref:glycosyltransferase family 2 protein n=1 Tax=Polynucleobacter sp. 15G-AUS-farblos TaxID=2689094 RepID=UPI001C0E588C|nr:glycosyltransferase family 2 protein [Polynucleobacter sp. 15G-AUS-farblos]MBU3584101.1 glycosyltransferase family 2 protein [Polynucleobacter sp. 15G-AUS-farblos]